MHAAIIAHLEDPERVPVKLGTMPKAELVRKDMVNVEGNARKVMRMMFSEEEPGAGGDADDLDRDIQNTFDAMKST